VARRRTARASFLSPARDSAVIALQHPARTIKIERPFISFFEDPQHDR
jgi:hypothetical protein